MKQHLRIIFCLSVAAIFGSVASAQNEALINPTPDGSGNIKGGSYSVLSIQNDNKDRTFTSAVIITGAGGTNLWGTGKTTFNGNLTRNKETETDDSDYGINITKGTNVFKGTVTDGYLSSDYVGVNYVVDGTGGNNVFEGAVNLWGSGAIYGDKSPNKTHAIGMMGGTHLFKSTVTTNGKNAGFFAKSVSTFNDHLDVGFGYVSIGYTPEVQEAGGSAFNLPARVILDGSNARITAAGVRAYDNGILEIRSNNTVNGNLNFKAGSEFQIDAKHTLTVSGATTIETGARVNVKNMDSLNAIGRTILTAESIDGSFSAKNQSLYNVKTEGNKIVIDSINETRTALGDDGIPESGNFNSVYEMADDIMDDSSSSELLRTNLANHITEIESLAVIAPAAARAAIAQAIGEHALAGAAATYGVAQNYAGSTMSHQTQLRDSIMAQADAPVGSASHAAFAALRAPGRPRTISRGRTFRPVASPYSSSSSSSSTSYSYSSSPFDPNRVWAGGFGAFTRQSDKDNQFGYRYNAGGFILGYDHAVGDFVFGLSAAYSAGRVKNNEGFTATDVDTVNAGLYASYNHPGGFFVDANAGMGFSWNKIDSTDIIGGGGLRKDGKYRNSSFQTGANLGYAFRLPGEFRITPSAGLQFTRVHQEGWSERIQSTSQIAHWFARSNNNYLSLPLQVRFSKTFRLGPEASITPELRAAWVYEVLDPRSELRMGFVGSSASATLHGMSSGRSRGIAGAGLKARFNRRLDGFVNYNLEFRNKYQNHNVMAGIGVSF